MTQEELFKKLVAHCKEYGFIFPSSEIYDGLSAVYDYGQMGVELKNNIKKYWWDAMTKLNENIVGIKHTSTNLYSLERTGQAFPGKALINGFDEQLLGALAMGSCATIGTTVNLFAPLFHRVRDAFDRGDMAQAYRWQHAINLRVEETVKLGIFNAMKYGWTLRGVDCGFCRAPFRPLDGAAREKMAQLMALPLEPV